MTMRKKTVVCFFVAGLFLAAAANLYAAPAPTSPAPVSAATAIAEAKAAIETARLSGAETNAQDDLAQAKSWLAQAEKEYAATQSLFSKSINLVLSSEAKNREIEYLAAMAKLKGQSAEAKSKKIGVEAQLTNARKELVDYQTTLDVLTKKSAEADQARKIKAQAEAEHKELAQAKQKAALMESQKLKELEEAKQRVAELEALKLKELTDASLKGQQLASQREKEEAELRALRQKMTVLDKTRAMLADAVKIPGAAVKTVEQDIVITIPAASVFSVKNEINAKGRSTLDQVANYLKKYADGTAAVRCYTDNTGRAETNRMVTEKRAQKVKAYLVDFDGMAEERITARGLGSTQPVADNSKAAGRSLNRRIEVAIPSPR